MKYCVDRIEGEIAVLENLDTQEMCDVSISELPTEIKDGTVLRVVDGKYEIDESAEEELSSEIDDLFNSLKLN